MFAAAGLADAFSSSVDEFALAAVVVLVADILGNDAPAADFCSSVAVGVALVVGIVFGLGGRTCIFHFLTMNMCYHFDIFQSVSYPCRFLCASSRKLY